MSPRDGDEPVPDDATPEDATPEDATREDQRTEEALPVDGSAEEVETVDDGTADDGDAAATEPEPGDTATDVPPAAVPPPARGVGIRRAALLGARVVTGVVGVAVAVAVVAAVSLIPLPGITVAIPSQRIVPEPADLVRVCAGSLLRLGDDSGQNAGTPTPIGTPAVVDAGDGAETSSLDSAPSDPDVLVAPAADGAELAASQSQTVGTRSLRGLAAVSCREPSSSSWLVAGDAGTGRTPLLTLSNPTDVEATVALQIWGEGGPVTAPGLSGIVVSARTQVVLPLAGFAPGLRSPVVQVDSRGGQVVATLQQSTVRAVDPGGVELTGGTAAPSTELTIPGVVVATTVETGGLIGREDYQDLRGVLRVLAPGAQDTAVRVSLVPDSPADAGTGSSFEVPVTAGVVQEIPLQEIPEGSYTVQVESDAPVVAGVRVAASAALTTDDPLESPVTDFAWFAAADPLGDATLLAVPAGPSPTLHLANDGDADAVVGVTVDGVAQADVTVPASGSVSLAVPARSEVALRGTGGLRGSVALVAPGAIATFVLAPPQPVSEPIIVHP